MALTNNKKICPFKEDPKLISKINYKDYKFLRKFITEQGKIIPGFVTGVSAKYQRMLTKEIKKARNIALLPYVHDPRNWYNLGDIYNENYFKTNSRVSRKSWRYC